MGHGHHHGEIKGRMAFSVILNFIIAFAEVIGGLLSGSLSLLSDSLHNFSDAMGLLASYTAIGIGERRANKKYTFGYKRAEILVAFMNSAVLVGVSFFLIVEAYRRFISPEPIDTSIMLPVAVMGLLANLLSVFPLHAHWRIGEDGIHFERHVEVDSIS